MAWTRIKRWLASALLFLAGLLLGVALFLPWEMVWSKVLNTANQKLSSLHITWTAVEDAGPLSLTVIGLKVQTKALPQPVTIQSLDLEFGLTPLVTARLDTGPVLTVQAFRSRSVRLNGGVNLANLLNRADVSGDVRLTGDASFPEWGQPPSNGRLEISSQALSLPQGVDAKEVSATAELEDNVLTVRSFQAQEPMPVEAAGTLTLNWSNLQASQYDFSGSLQLGSKTHKFKKAGRLNKLPGM
jgi:hypothetical protein